jgi:hypothetical protein
MWKNILIIFIIILLSYIFTLKDKNYFDLQILFIVLSIAILIIYKLMFVSNLNKTENFDTEHENVNDFFQGKTTTPVANSDKNVKLEDLSTKLMDLQSALELNNKKQTPTENLERENLAFKNQENDIHVLEKKVDELKEYLYLSNEEKNEKFYKKIPVYNSCKVTKRIKETSSQKCEDNKSETGCKTQGCTWTNGVCGNATIPHHSDQTEFIKDIFSKFATSIAGSPEFKINLA